MSQTLDEERNIAEGVDDDVVEGNRRIFEDWRFMVVAIAAGLYAAWHMAALTGLSISAMTGIEIPFLPQFPMETWNFRIAHVAGALILGFLFYAPNAFPETESEETHKLGLTSGPGPAQAGPGPT